MSCRSSRSLCHYWKLRRLSLFNGLTPVTCSTRCISKRPIATAAARPPSIPKPNLDIKHIRDSPGLYETNCLQRNYENQSKNSWKILEGHQKWLELNQEVRKLYIQQKKVQEEFQQARNQIGGESNSQDENAVQEQARDIKRIITQYETGLSEILENNHKLALELPNLASPLVPDKDTAETVEHINVQLNNTPPVIQVNHQRSHVEIGRLLDIIDIPAAAAISGWGFYFLKGAGAMLEQALIQHALSHAMAASFVPISPPSLVYEYVASSAGYQPRDTNDEQQIYEIRKDEKERSEDSGLNESPRLVLTGTSEIALAAMHAGSNIPEASFPIKNVAISRCYRAEAGARGRDTKGLYRVHEFTKVELFAWTLPDNYNAQKSNKRFATTSEADLANKGYQDQGNGEDMSQPSSKMLHDMLDLQKRILTPLNLPLRILDMPMVDLGASAARKFDIEAFFPSRTHDPWGELSSLSLCTDYQSRRLFTRVSRAGDQGRPVFPYTLNGTAMAVPRVLAAILENGWDEERSVVRLPECLWSYMGRKEIAVEERRV